MRVGNQGILTRDNGSVMGHALESAADHSSMLPRLLLPPLYCRAASLTPNTHCVSLTLAFGTTSPTSVSLFPVPPWLPLVFHVSTCSGTSWGSRHLVNRFTSVIKEYLCSALPGKERLSLLAVIGPCLSRVLGILIHPWIRSHRRAWHAKTNMALPTRQESLCLSAVIPG